MAFRRSELRIRRRIRYDRFTGGCGLQCSLCTRRTKKEPDLLRLFLLVLAVETTYYTRNFRRRVPRPIRVPPSSISVIPPSGTYVSKPCETLVLFPLGESQANWPT